MEPKTNPRAKEYKICDKCKNAWVEHPFYNYCPSCMNDFYNEQGVEPVVWYTNADGITVAATKKDCKWWMNSIVKDWEMVTKR